jgi:hypothetical protein
MKTWLWMSIGFFALTLVVVAVAWLLGPASLTEGAHERGSPVSQEMPSYSTLPAPQGK